MKRQFSLFPALLYCRVAADGWGEALCATTPRAGGTAPGVPKETPFLQDIAVGGERWRPPAGSNKTSVASLQIIYDNFLTQKRWHLT